MNSRRLTLLLSNASLIFLIIGIAIGIRFPILHRFERLEQDLMEKRLVRVMDALVQQGEKLDSSAKAEAIWTEMYDYMATRNSAARHLATRHSNFYAETYPYEGMATSTMDLLALFDRQGKAVHLTWLDRHSKKLTLPSQAIQQALLQEQSITAFPADTSPALSESRNFAILAIPEGLLLIAARPILTGEAEGPRQGTLVMGVLMDQQFLMGLEKRRDVRLRLLPLSSLSKSSLSKSSLSKSSLSGRSPTPHPASHPAAASDASPAAIPVIPLSDPAALIRISPRIQALNSEWIQGNIVLLNSDRQPLRSLSVEVPRLEYREGVETLNQLAIVLCFLGVGLSLVISYLIDRSMRQQQLLQISETALQAANRELHLLANLDGLTQIANRRCFEQRLHQEWDRAQREQTPLTLILCDVDYFKSYNDTYGHPAGDRCLQQVAQAIAQSVRRSGDCVARYGGEEFAVLLPNTDLPGGLCIAKAIEQVVKQLHIEHQGSSVSSLVSLSLGIAAVIPHPALTVEVLVKQSDQNLYRAKQQGRDRIEC